MNDMLEEYKKQAEIQKREKAYVWQTAIGLQAVDGLETSDYLISTAKKISTAISRLKRREN